MRAEFELNALEFRQFKRLTGQQGDAYGFWRKVALDRGLDYKTLLPPTHKKPGVWMTGLPRGHGKHWNWPHPLKCQKKVNFVEGD